MSNSVFPSFAGLKMNVRRAPVFATKVQTSPSGKEVRGVFQSTPRYRYVLDMEFLRTAVNGNEVTTLLNFLETHKGSWDSFLFNDPLTGSQVRVRFEEDELEVEQFASGFWSVKNIKLITVK